MSDLISKGRHLAVCSGSVQFGETGEGDNKKEQVVVQFVVNDEHSAFNGWTISWFGYFTDKTIDRTFEALRYLGWVGDELAELPDLAAAGQLSNQVEIVIDHEEYEGEWQAKVRWVNKPGGGAVRLKKPLEGRELASFSARMKMRARASAQGALTKPANGTRGTGGGQQSMHPNAPGNKDSDIPF